MKYFIDEKMVCILECKSSGKKFQFNSDGLTQQILIDILLRYDILDMTSLVSSLDTSKENIQAILEGEYFFESKEADDLAQLFLIHFGEFLKKCSLKRLFD